MKPTAAIDLREGDVFLVNQGFISEYLIVETRTVYRAAEGSFEPGTVRFGVRALGKPATGTEMIPLKPLKDYRCFGGTLLQVCTITEVMNVLGVEPLPDRTRVRHTTSDGHDYYGFIETHRLAGVEVWYVVRWDNGEFQTRHGYSAFVRSELDPVPPTAGTQSESGGLLD